MLILSVVMFTGCRTLAAVVLRDRVDALAVTAVDEAAPVERRSEALGELHRLGDIARPAGPRIAHLASRHDDLGNAAMWALSEMRWPPAAEVLAQRVRTHGAGDRMLTFDRLCQMGSDARPALPFIASRLHDTSPEVWPYYRRIPWCLKEVGGPAALPLLIDALEDSRISVVTAAMHELTELSALSAIQPLRRLARTHWHSAVRERAGVTAEAIQARSRERRRVEVTGAGNNWCLGSTPPVVEMNGARLRLDPERRPQTRPQGFPAVELGHLRADWAKDLKCPHTYERVESGWLVTTDCGEWGASVDFVSDAGTVTRVPEAEGHEFIRFGDKLLLVGGTDHMGLNWGHVLELYEDTSGWNARWFAEPIGHVYESRVLPDGLLLVTKWGASVLRPDGSQFEVRCVPSE